MWATRNSKFLRHHRMWDLKMQDSRKNGKLSELHSIPFTPPKDEGREKSPRFLQASHAKYEDPRR